MSNHWWRAYDEAVDDPKLQRLGPKLGWAWFNLMCITSANGGTLPAIGDIAFKLRTSEQQAAATVAALAAAGLFVKTNDGHYAPHNWDGRQYKTDKSDNTNAERQRRHRAHMRDELRELKALRESAHISLRMPLRNGVSHVTAKRPDTDTDITPTARVERRGLAGEIMVSSELVTSLGKK